MNDDKTIRLTVIQQAVDIENSRFKSPDHGGKQVTGEEIVETARKLYEFVNGDKAPATKE